VRASSRGVDRAVKNLCRRAGACGDDLGTVLRIRPIACTSTRRYLVQRDSASVRTRVACSVTIYHG
jgi:hypothetical protein